MFKKLMAAQRAHVAKQKTAIAAVQARPQTPEQIAIAEMKAQGMSTMEIARAMQAAKHPDRPVPPTFRQMMAAQVRGVGVELQGEELLYQGQRESVRGVTATLTHAGAVRARPTVTRFVAFGLMPGVPGLAALVAQKKVDERELWLVIDGPDFQWAAAADPKRSANVHQLAAAINTAARRLA